jgi:hypothetical protein
MTELTYTSNHFFDGIHIRFDITAWIPSTDQSRYTGRFTHQQEHAMNRTDIAHLSAA